MVNVAKFSAVVFRILAFAALSAAALHFVPSARAAETVAPVAPTSCTLESGPIRTVTRILDGETVALDDGSEVRLIGALAPRAFDTNSQSGAWPPEANAVRTLTDLVLGRAVKLAYGGRRTDRYGRQLAHLFLSGDHGEDNWVQGAMLNAGAARAYGIPGSFACSVELLANERVAKSSHIGIWATTTYAPKPAKLIGLLLRRRSHFEIVEGSVTTVSRTKSAIYLNFGNDWKTDFTARIGKPVLDANPAFDQTLASLEGKTISVRGWIERRNGPMIDILDPAQITIDGDLAQPDLAVSERGEPNSTDSVVAPHADVPAAPASEILKNKRPAFVLPKPPGDVDL